jgi:hypothetical protein
VDELSVLGDGEGIRECTGRMGSADVSREL